MTMRDLFVAIEKNVLTKIQLIDLIRLLNKNSNTPILRMQQDDH